MCCTLTEILIIHPDTHATAKKDEVRTGAHLQCMPVTEAHDQLLGEGFAQRGLPCARRPVQQHGAVEGDQLGVHTTLPKKNSLHHEVPKLHSPALVG